MTKGVQGLLRTHGPALLERMHSRLGGSFARIADALEDLLLDDLRSADDCIAFWNAIPAATKGCPEPEHLMLYQSILAYAFVHVLDRYLRTWAALEVLLQSSTLPLPARLAVLDVGSGPASALYAVADFYAALADGANALNLPRLAINPPSLCPVEMSRGMRHLFHNLTERLESRRPFVPGITDFSAFKPDELRDGWKRANTVEYTYWDPDENTWVDVPYEGDLERDTDLHHRYQFVILSNFLTTPTMLSDFREQVEAAFLNQSAGGVVMLMGGAYGRYPDIYEQVDEIATRTAHAKVVDETIDDTSRRPFFGRMKKLSDRVWQHVSALAGIDLPQVGYPKYNDPGAPIERLPPFALRAYRRRHPRGSPSRSRGSHPV